MKLRRPYLYATWIPGKGFCLHPLFYEELLTNLQLVWKEDNPQSFNRWWLTQDWIDKNIL